MLDDTIKRTVQQVEVYIVTLITKDGFPMKFMARDLVKVQGKISVSNFEVSQIKKEKEIPKRKNTVNTKPKERNLPKMEVDLHIHQLVKSTKGLTNFDMLNIQLETAKRQLDFAIQKRIQKVVFIHGVGEGVLKDDFLLFSSDAANTLDTDTFL